MGIEIRLLGESDLPAALRLKELAHWNQTENDWRRLIQLEPNGCFCATNNGEVVATTTATTYGRELAWIGMVLVDPEYRRRGIATRLMDVALEYLTKQGLETIKLDATPDGRLVYENLGFKEESLIERWEAISAGEERVALNVKSVTRDQIFSLDRREFGADRTSLVELLIKDSCFEPRFATDADGRLTGYGLARRGSVAIYLGPVVAEHSTVAPILLDEMLGQVLHQRTYVDLNTNFEQGWEILRERGFAKQRNLIRMSYGKDKRAGSSPSIFAIAGPEVG
jgi:ribosomal protein S18 acetylase RimI-like enzyme